MARLHHIALGALDVERVATFYGELFEAARVATHHDPSGRLRSVWLDVDGTLLMVERTDAPGTRVEGVGNGPFLLAFAVTVAERRALEARVAEMGGRIEDRTAYSSYTRDPEDNRVAFSHHPIREDAPAAPR